MIRNESVQRLIACDKETLIALMAAAADRYGDWNRDRDPDIRALIDAAKALNARAATLTPPQHAWMPKRMRVRS